MIIYNKNYTQKNKSWIKSNPKRTTIKTLRIMDNKWETKTNKKLNKNNKIITMSTANYILPMSYWPPS